MNFAKNDLIWPLTSVEAPKFLFEFDHSHICCKVWYAEQVALFSGSVAPKLREKNESNTLSDDELVAIYVPRGTCHIVYVEWETLII